MLDDQLNWREKDGDWCLYKGGVYLARLVQDEHLYLTDIDEPLAEYGCSIVHLQTLDEGKAFLEDWARKANLSP